MKLHEWLEQDERVAAEDPTPRGVQDAVVLEHLQGRERGGHRRPWRLLVLLVLLGLLVALFKPLSERAARLAPPIAAVGEVLLQTSDTWEGYKIFPVDRSSVVLAAIADGAWPRPQRAWPDVRALPIDIDLYAVGPDLNGSMMYYAIPGPARHAAWLASPGPDGVWSSGAETPQAVAAAIDKLARRIEQEALARVRREDAPGPWSYNVRWGDDHIVLFRVMLLARGRTGAVRALLRAAPEPLPMDVLNLPGLWADRAPAAAKLLAAIHEAHADAAEPAAAAGD